MNNSTTNYDILIIGAGVVGLTFACALKNAGLKIAIIDEHGAAPQWKKEDYHHRVSAVNLVSQQIFANLNVWDDMKKMRISPYHEMRVWDATGVGEIHFNSASIGKPNLGHIVENNVMQAALNNAVQDAAAITSINHVKPISLTLAAQHAVVKLNNGDSIQAKLLIGADGANSWVRQHLNTQVTTRSYEQKALVATVRTEKPHNKTAQQRFLPTGPLAFLPLADSHLCSIVWSAATSEAERLLKLSPADFNVELTKAFDHRLGKVECIQPLHAFPLYKQHAHNYVSDRIALIGDAAHVIHPLAGQGLNLGLADAQCLADVVLNAQPLRRYERWRKGDNYLMMQAMSGFKNLFVSKNPWLMMLRNLGLCHVDDAQILKRFFMNHALGSLSRE